jgi:hypothetical protein
MKFKQLLRIIFSIIIGELVLVIATTIAQEVLFDGISIASPLPVIIFGGLATFAAAILAGFAARIILNQTYPIVAMIMTLLIILETSYLILADKTSDPVWFDCLAAASLILGVWLGFYILHFAGKIRK